MTLPVLIPRTLLAVPLVGAALLLPHPQPAQAAPTTLSREVVASATTHDLRLVVTATKTSGGGAPTATVHVTPYRRGASGWQSQGDLRLGAPRSFFWDTLSGAHAVRDLTISDAPAAGSVQLLVTPALGWSPIYHFHIEHGHLVR